MIAAVVVPVAVAAVPPPPDAAGPVARPPALKALKAGISFSTSSSAAFTASLSATDGASGAVAGVLIAGALVPGGSDIAR